MGPTSTPNNNQPPLPNTSEFDRIQAALAANRTDIGSRMADVTAVDAKYSPATDSTIAGMRSNQASKIQQLFDHDSKLATTYFPVGTAGGPTTGEVAQPAGGQAIIDPTIGMTAANNQQISTAKEATDIGTQIANRKDELATSRQSAIDLITKALDIKKQEQSDLQAELDVISKKANNALAVLQETGGVISPEIANILGTPELAGKKILSPAEKLAAQFGATDAGRAMTDKTNLQADAAGGMVLKDIIKKYKGGPLTDQEIVGLYDSSGKWGAHKETMSQLKQMGLSNLKPGDFYAPTNTENNQIIDNVGAIDTIDQAINALQKIQGTDFESGFGPVGGNVSKALFTANLGGLLQPDVKDAISKMNLIQGVGDRKIVGGRLIGSLVKLFGPSFVGPQYSVADNIKKLQDMRKQTIQGMDIYAKNKGLTSFTDIPGLEGISSLDQGKTDTRPPLTNFDKP